MDTSVSTDSDGVEQELAVIAQLCIRTDLALVGINQTQIELTAAWSGAQRILADKVAALLIAGVDPVTTDIQQALGGAFAAGPLAEAGVRLGYLTASREAGSFVETPAGDGFLALIEHAVG